jgi:hypothetical protein
MRTLKTLVIVMGLSVVIGASVLATLIMTRGSNLVAEGQAEPQAVKSQKSKPLAGQRALKLSLKLPVGARVLESRIAAERLTLRAGLKGGGEAIFVFDAASGQLLTRYDIATEAMGTR